MAKSGRTPLPDRPDNLSFGILTKYGWVESRMGAVAWGLWPTLRFPSPLISRVEGWRAGVARESRPTPRLQPPPSRPQRADFPHCAPPFASRQSLWDLSRWGDFRPVASHSIGIEQP